MDSQCGKFPVLKAALIADQLKALWSEVDAGRLPYPQFEERQEKWLQDYIDLWRDALLLPGESDLKKSLCRELGSLVGCDDPVELERRCRSATADLRQEWERDVTLNDEGAVERFYDRSTAYIYDLMWWHTLQEDRSPLAYVSALHLAVREGCGRTLDFGSGVGAGSLLFARHGLEITLADISSTLLDFARRRLESRGISAGYLDLKTDALPAGEFDFISAMDVFEHIAEPAKTVDLLAAALRPGGILFGRFNADVDSERPQHIAGDFAPTFTRLAELGFEQCWRDEWLWGHQAFCRKS